MARKIIGMARKIDPTRSWPRRWRVLLSLVVIVAASVVFMKTVQAVHDLGFELDGNTIAGDAPAPFTGLDWNSIFNVGAGGVGVPVDPLPAGFDHAVFVRDFSTQIIKNSVQFANGDATTYATGSKDTLPISTGAQTWQCGASQNVNDKDDILNAYGASYTDPGTGHEILYFGMERNANNGDANFGFWFLQDEVGCVPAANGGAANFTGQHMTGDLFIVSAFSNGGTVSTITVYQWVGDNDTGGLSPTPVASGADCRSGTTTLGDPACGAANTAGITLNWLTAEKTDGVGNTLRTAEFFEGGLDLTQANLTGKCFNTFVGNTRSSTSLTATIFDWAGGTLGQCQSTTTTQSNKTGSISIGTGSVPNVHDTATIAVDGVDTFSATVTFYLCGPSTSAITLPCDDGTNGTEGVQIGDPQSITANGSKQSEDVTLTSVGKYCWGAVFSGDSDAGVPGSQDDGANECFEVSPVTPVIVTTAGPDVDFGQAVTDTAVLTGLATQPGTDGVGPGGTINATNGAAAGGSLAFTLYGPGACGAGNEATGTGTNPQSVTVTGNGSYGPVSFTPDAPGGYSWAVGYTPLATDPNNLASSHNLDCEDEAEDVVVSQIPTEIKTKQDWIPNDTVTITSTNATADLPAGGSVVFTLYESANCTGTVRYTESKGLTGGDPSEELSTSNTGTGAGMFRVTTDYPDGSSSKGPFSWKVVYTPPAGAFVGKQSSCATAASTESFTINYHNDAGPGTDLE